VSICEISNAYVIKLQEYEEEEEVNFEDMEVVEEVRFCLGVDMFVLCVINRHRSMGGYVCIMCDMLMLLRWRLLNPVLRLPCIWE
jgi:hypothetical protein